MNNKEFIAKLAEQLQLSIKETQSLTNHLVTTFTDVFEDGNNIALQGFGTFEVKKKNERVIVNPTTKQKQLVPPKMVLSFKPSVLLKDKMNEMI